MRETKAAVTLDGTADALLAVLSDVRLPWAVLGLGAAARLGLYLHGRSLWLDEAMLSRNIVERSYAGLMQPLGDVQCAPIGFLWAERLFGSHWGFSEYGLRLFPLACGLASLVLMLRLAQRLLTPIGAAFAVIMFSSTYSLVYYSAEVKQYSTEVFVALSLVTLALRALEQPAWSVERVALAAGGALAIFFSFSSVFVLFGIGLVWLHQAWRSRKPKDLAACAGGGALWLGAFAAYQYFILRHYNRASQVDAFGGYAYFWPLPPRSLGDLLWPIRVLAYLAREPLGLSYPLPGLLLAGVGAAVFYVRHRNYSLMILLALAGALGASAFRRYPFGDRLTLYLTPFLLIWLAGGLDALRERLGRSNAIVSLAFIAFFACAPISLAFGLAVKPDVREEVKPALAKIEREGRPGDLLYVYNATRPAFLFYRDRYPKTAAMTAVLAPEADYNRRTVARTVETLQKSPRAWLLFTHCYDEERCLRMFTEYSMERGARKASLTTSADSWLYLYDHEK